ncbi:hypothetical protein M501DRAFT_991406 [Patellaria atrata CBS 101060]|uniref:Uncharacterized protein n=1 Tax=Patellaria atrata CBS 101060 TaxID=1346257 RepID=A0A9P4VQZ6_9PEZI|nr:hypothetical protein M501DRAFT_991406 [Patellaria atrata CBS 101060]
MQLSTLLSILSILSIVSAWPSPSRSSNTKKIPDLVDDFWAQKPIPSTVLMAMANDPIEVGEPPIPVTGPGPGEELRILWRLIYCGLRISFSISRVRTTSALSLGLYDISPEARMIASSVCPNKETSPNFPSTVPSYLDKIGSEEC